MIKTIRARILVISSLAVVTALAITGAVSYQIVRSNTMQAIEQNLRAITEGNTVTIETWVSSKAAAVQATADAVRPGDPQGLVVHMAKSNGFRIATVGWEDKSFVSSNPNTPATFDPTARPWYKSAVAAGRLLVTKPYADATTGAPFVSFAAPLMREGKATGVLSGVMPLQVVQEVAAAIRPTPNSVAFVVDKDGMLLAAPASEMTLKASTELSPALTPERLRELAGGSMVAPLDLGGEKLLKIKEIKGTDWYLAVGLDVGDATASLREIVRLMVLSVVLLALATAGISALLTAQSFRRLNAVRDALDEISQSGGDLTRRLPVVGNDEVDQIARAFNAFVSKIGLVLCDIRDGAQAVHAATNEIKVGNMDLSSRTERSAGNIEETAASLDELNNAVRQLADSAQLASRLTASANQAAGKGGEAMQGVVSTMGEIAEASSRIGEIIGVIDGIAFRPTSWP